MSGATTDAVFADWTLDDRDALPFSSQTVAALAEQTGLRVPDAVLGAVTAAIRAGKHVILTGPPGTGKSTLAQLIADAGQRALMCTGSLFATATSDWTVADTIGASIDSSQGPIFRAGVATEAMQTGRWLVIDEFNRADIDRCFGELFSVLAGQAVVLPHRRTELAPPLSVVPFGREVPQNTEPICIPKPWRIIGTMNSADRGLLFSLSHALMRRFAVVHVESPDQHVFRELVEGPGDIVADLLKIRELQNIGPAVFLDAADYAAIRRMDGVSRSQVLLEAFSTFVMPQLDEPDDDTMPQLLAILDPLLDRPEQATVRRLLLGR